MKVRKEQYYLQTANADCVQLKRKTVGDDRNNYSDSDSESSKQVSVLIILLQIDTLNLSKTIFSTLFLIHIRLFGRSSVLNIIVNWLKDDHLKRIIVVWQRLSIQ